jgi:hypothetical protein
LLHVALLFASAVAGTRTAHAQGAPPDFEEQAAIRQQLTEVNRGWSAVRLNYDSATANRMLTPDFYVQMFGQRIAREAFIAQVSQRPLNGRLVRFDNPVLTVTRGSSPDEWVAVVLEKLESERTLPDGTVDRIYNLWITRDGYRRVGNSWQIMYSEAIGAEAWGNGRRPPMTDW